MSLDAPLSTDPSHPLRVDRAHAEAFILTLAEALHAHGAAAHRLEGLLTLVAARLGIEARFYSTPTVVLASFGVLAEGHTCLVRVQPGAINLEKISLLYETTVSVIRAEIGPEEGRAKVAAIVSAKPRYGAPWTVLSSAVFSASAAVLFGGGGREVLASGAVGLVVGLIVQAMRRWSARSAVVEPVAAAVAAVAASLAAHLTGPLSTLIVTLAGAVMLLPGLGITTAMTELATRNLASGTARFSGALVQLAGLGFGVAFGTGLVRLLPALPAPPPPTEWSTLALGCAVLAASTAISTYLQTRPRDLPWIVAVCGLGFLGTRLGGRLLGPELGAFLGALVIGLASNAVARKYDRPASVGVVPGLLLLVPGSLGFRGVVSMLENDVASGAEATFKAGMISVSLVAGILFANLWLPPRRAL
ncbi:threonine/serine ThrE exporter family protein [Chondromyces apiculatus]|nr:threonine/serine exporter family protein [Chondromyces apiculatus]